MTTIVELTKQDIALARSTFATMAGVFGEEASSTSDTWLERLLGRESFIAFAAVVDQEPVGGITAHVLPMTIAERSELFVYDLAIRVDHQRKGLGRRLVAALREEAARRGIDDVIVPADNADGYALDFYRALGGAPTAATIFHFAKLVR
jgi:aminoglycoside 3-N-acetyltransferase I